MDRHLKERLIGATVLVAAAIILIPEMLSGPKDASPSAQQSDELKSYTIDLSKSSKPQIAAPPAIVSNAPAPNESAPTPTVHETAAPPPEEHPPPADAAVQSVPASGATSKSASPTVSAPSLSRSETGLSRGWTVQVGSFGVRATADRIAAELQHEGFPAFVVAFQSGTQTLYRVRVGPERERPAAESLMHKLKARHPQATLVPPP